MIIRCTVIDCEFVDTLGKKLLFSSPAVGSLCSSLWRVNATYLRCCLVLLCLVSACTGSPERSPGTFVIGVESSPTTLDPRLAVDAYSSKLVRLIYAGLFRLDTSLQLQANLLASYQQISPTQYRFTLRSDLTFHDGQPLTAHDVAWNYNSIREQRVPSPHYATFSKIERLEVLDKQKFTITLKEPFAPFLTALTLGILKRPESGLKASMMIGAGPYKLETFVPDEKVVLHRFDNYFAGKPRAARLIFRVMRDDNLRVLELVRGRLDLLQNSVPAPLMTYVKRRADLVVESAPSINYIYMGFNLEDPYLSHEKVRKAFAYALDIPTIISYKLKGYARPATGILAPMHWAYSDSGVRYPYNPNQAQQLLDEAGFPDPDGPGPQTRFKIYYKTSSKRDRIGMARLLAQYLHKVGVDVVVTPYDWGTFYRDIRQGNFQLYSLTWVGVTEPDKYYDVFHSAQIPPQGNNRNRYRNGAIDQLTAAGRATVDVAKRKEIYREVQKIVAQELPYISLWYEDVVVVRRKDVKGYTIYPNASYLGLMNLYRETKLSGCQDAEMSGCRHQDIGTSAYRDKLAETR